MKEDPTDFGDYLQVVTSRTTSGEKKLLFATLLDAWQSISDCRTPQALADYDMEWFASEDTTWPFSFARIMCDLLPGWAASTVRAKAEAAHATASAMRAAIHMGAAAAPARIRREKVHHATSLRVSADLCREERTRRSSGDKRAGIA